MWTLFKYLYRDAGNFKTHGAIALHGQIDRTQIGRVDAALESGEFFIAEQVGVPPLQIKLQSDFGGRTKSDHCWHSFEGWEVVEMCPMGAIVDGDVGGFVARFDRVKVWDEGLSPEFGLI